MCIRDSQYASTIRKQNEVIAQEQARQEKARKEAEEKAKNCLLYTSFMSQESFPVRENGE